MQGLLVGDVFFRSFMVEFDMTQRERPIIGIAPLNTKYAPVRAAELGTFELHHAPVSKLQLLRGEETMFPAEHTQRLTQVDQIPIFNKKGTQYFMDVGVGSPKQPFTVIFDTGSAVLGVFVVKHDLPMSIRSQLPDDVMSQDLLLEQTRTSSTGGFRALMSMYGYTDSKPIMYSLLGLNVLAVGLVATLVRRNRNKKKPSLSGHASAVYGTSV